MLRTVLSSSSLRSVGYDRAGRVLEIEFIDGSVYRYADVPREVYEGLRDASSPGRYFAASVREQYADSWVQ